jgi:hypothetical protein
MLLRVYLSPICYNMPLFNYIFLSYYGVIVVVIYVLVPLLYNLYASFMVSLAQIGVFIDNINLF